MLRIPSILFLTCIQRPVIVYHALDASGEGDFMKRGIDDLDKGIILELQQDARRPFSVIAENLNVAEGTVRNRVRRLIDRDVLELKARVNPFALSDKVAAIIGINLAEKIHEQKVKEIEKIPSVTSAWNATGRFDLFFEVMADTLAELNEILFEKDLHTIGGITHSEVFVILSSNTKRFRLS